MRITSIQVEFKKMVSDGNYGHEMSVASLTADLVDGEDAVVAAETLMDICVGRVYARLGDSSALQVRRALQRQTRDCYECKLPMDDFEPGQMHAACREARDAREREANERWQRRQVAQVVLSGPTDDEDDDRRTDPDDHGDAEDLENLPV